MWKRFLQTTLNYGALNVFHMFILHSIQPINSYWKWRERYYKLKFWFLAFHTFKNGTQKMRAKPLQPFPVHGFILYYVYFVNTALKGSGMKDARCHLLHNISSEGIKSILISKVWGLTQQNVINLQNVLEVFIDVSLFGFLSILVLKLRTLMLSTLYCSCKLCRGRYIIHKLKSINSLPWLFIEFTLHFW